MMDMRVIFVTELIGLDRSFCLKLWPQNWWKFPSLKCIDIFLMVTDEAVLKLMTVPKLQIKYNDIKRCAKLQMWRNDTAER